MLTASRLLLLVSGVGRSEALVGSRSSRTKWAGLVGRLVFLCLANSATADDTQHVLASLSAMEAAWSNVQDYTMQVEKTERQVDGRVTRQTVALKFRRPDQYYFLVLNGDSAGAELIYPKSASETIAIAHPGGRMGRFTRFLQRTVVLRGLVPTEFSLTDPRIVRGQHQTVLESNLGRTIHRIAGNIRTALERGEGKSTLSQDCSGTVTCLLRIDVALPAEAGTLHRVQEGENLWTLGTQYDLPMYVIWYNNPDMREPTDVRPGRELFIPRYYAARGHIWIDPANQLPAKLEIYDAQGRLYERYVYSSVQTNVGLEDHDFDPGNPEYHFLVRQDARQ